MSSDNGKACCGPGYASPREDMQAEREKLLYTVAQMFLVDCDTENGGMTVNPDFVVDFKDEPNGPARAVTRCAIRAAA